MGVQRSAANTAARKAASEAAQTTQTAAKAAAKIAGKAAAKRPEGEREGEANPGQEGWGPEGWVGGREEGPENVEGPNGGGEGGQRVGAGAEKFALFFFSFSRVKFHSLCSLWASSRGISVFDVVGSSDFFSFFFLLGGPFVEFLWCLKRRTFGPSRVVV